MKELDHIIHCNLDKEARTVPLHYQERYKSDLKLIREEYSEVKNEDLEHPTRYQEPPKKAKRSKRRRITRSKSPKTTPKSKEPKNAKKSKSIEKSVPTPPKVDQKDFKFLIKVNKMLYSSSPNSWEFGRLQRFGNALSKKIQKVNEMYSPKNAALSSIASSGMNVLKMNQGRDFAKYKMQRMMIQIKKSLLDSFRKEVDESIQALKRDARIEARRKKLMGLKRRREALMGYHQDVARIVRMGFGDSGDGSGGGRDGDGDGREGNGGGGGSDEVRGGVDVVEEKGYKTPLKARGGNKDGTKGLKSGGKGSGRGLKSPQKSKKCLPKKAKKTAKRGSKGAGKGRKSLPDSQVNTKTGSSSTSSSENSITKTEDSQSLKTSPKASSTVFDQFNTRQKDPKTEVNQNQLEGRNGSDGDSERPDGPENLPSIHGDNIPSENTQNNTNSMVYFTTTKNENLGLTDQFRGVYTTAKKGPKTVSFLHRLQDSPNGLEEPENDSDQKIEKMGLNELNQMSRTRGPSKQTMDMLRRTNIFTRIQRSRFIRNSQRRSTIKLPRVEQLIKPSRGMEILNNMRNSLRRSQMGSRSTTHSKFRSMKKTGFSRSKSVRKRSVKGMGSPRSREGSTETQKGEKMDKNENLDFEEIEGSEAFLRKASMHNNVMESLEDSEVVVELDNYSRFYRSSKMKNINFGAKNGSNDQHGDTNGLNNPNTGSSKGYPVDYGHSGGIQPQRVIRVESMNIHIGGSRSGNQAANSLSKTISEIMNEEKASKNSKNEKSTKLPPLTSNRTLANNNRINDHIRIEIDSKESKNRPSGSVSRGDEMSVFDDSKSIKKLIRDLTDFRLKPQKTKRAASIKTYSLTSRKRSNRTNSQKSAISSLNRKIKRQKEINQHMTLFRGKREGILGRNVLRSLSNTTHIDRIEGINKIEFLRNKACKRFQKRSAASRVLDRVARRVKSQYERLDFLGYADKDFIKGVA